MTYTFLIIKDLHLISIITTERI